jgi:xanthine/CO dehydrogenase XdhC/CoxF family maturation factor
MVDVLLEPAGSAEFEMLMEALEASLRGEQLRVVTRLPEGERRLERVVDEALDGEVFEEWLEAPQRLFVFGAGDDARPMVQMAGLIGWSVVVVDGRETWARAERFPEAARVVVGLSVGEMESAGLRVGRRDAVVVMTHSYEQDRRWLAELLPAVPRYLGLLGARHRSALLVSEVAARLGWSVERVCEGLFAPVGLDLGGDGAEAIALAVVAEIQAWCEGKLGVSRRLTPEMVAEQMEKGGASVYLASCAL